MAMDEAKGGMLAMLASHADELRQFQTTTETPSRHREPTPSVRQVDIVNAAPWDSCVAAAHYIAACYDSCGSSGGFVVQ